MKYLWWVVSAVTGGAIAWLLKQLTFLHAPMFLVVGAYNPVKSILSVFGLTESETEMLTIPLLAAVMAVPRSALFGVVVGGFAPRIRFKRTLIYSVPFWPMLYLFEGYIRTLLVEQGAPNTAASAALVNFQWEALRAGCLFWTAASTTFLLFTFVAYHFSIRFGVHKVSASSSPRGEE